MNSFTLKINGNIKPKQRPRFDSRSNRTHHCNDYLDWKEQAIAQLQSQWTTVKIGKAKISITLKGSLRGDLDNLSGSILDALVQAEILEDDRLSCIPELNIKHVPGKVKGAEIVIEPIDAEFAPLQGRPRPTTTQYNNLTLAID